MPDQLTVSVVVDNESWILTYADQLVSWCKTQGHTAALCRSHAEVSQGDLAFYLGCVKITPDDILTRNKLNLVVHESNLPKGRGFAPMSWQILEGNSLIPVCLIEAASGTADSGDIYARGAIPLQGHELCLEWRDLQGRETLRLCCEFIKTYPQGISPRQQTGEPESYPRRRPSDSMLDINKTIAEQFDLLRIVDNDRYPAFFEHRGHRYILRIEKDKENPTS